MESLEFVAAVIFAANVGMGAYFALTGRYSNAGLGFATAAFMLYLLLAKGGA